MKRRDFNKLIPAGILGVCGVNVISAREAEGKSVVGDFMDFLKNEDYFPLISTLHFGRINELKNVTVVYKYCKYYDTYTGHKEFDSYSSDLPAYDPREHNKVDLHEDLRKFIGVCFSDISDMIGQGKEMTLVVFNSDDARFMMWRCDDPDETLSFASNDHIDLLYTLTK